MNTIYLKENPARLLLPYLPEIQPDDRRKFDQESKFQVSYKGRIIGTVRLAYRLPFRVANLRESQTYMVYNKPVGWLKTRLQLDMGAGFTNDAMLVYILFQWEERDLIAFEQIMKELWEDIVQENPSQHQIQLAI